MKARSLVKLCYSSPNLSADDVRILESVGEFLTLAERLCSLGQPGSQAYVTLENPAAARKSADPRPILSQFSSLLVRAHWLASKRHSVTDPKPWLKGSPWNALQTELDEHILVYPGVSPTKTEQLSSDGTIADIGPSMALILCHCTRVALSKPFMPALNAQKDSSSGDPSFRAFMNWPGRRLHS